MQNPSTVTPSHDDDDDDDDDNNNNNNSINSLFMYKLNRSKTSYVCM
jgi:hypothetical protein